MAPKKSASFCIHGHQWVDEFAWMQEGISKELFHYINDENRYCDAVLSEWAEFREHLKREISQLDDLCSQSPSYGDIQVIGDFVYYQSISEKGTNTFCRRSIISGEERILLDATDLAEEIGKPHVVITRLTISPCQRFLGVVVESSPDVYEGHIFSIESDAKPTGLECIHNIVNLEFGAKESVLYTTADSLWSHQVWCHQIGSSTADDHLIFEETDARFFVDLSHTKDRRFAAINCNSQTTSEVWLIDVHGSVENPPTLIWPRRDGVECYIDHCKDTLFALANPGPSRELKLISAQSSGLSKRGQGLKQSTLSWRDMFVPPPGCVLQDMDVFSSACVLCVVANNVPQLITVPHISTSGKPSFVELPADCTSLVPGVNSDHNSATFQFQLSSPVLPPRDFEVDLQTGHVCCHDKDTLEVLTGQNRKKKREGNNPWTEKGYACTRMLSSSRDGTQVPMTVIHNKHLRLDGSNPLLVIGYGAYGRSVDMQYCTERRALVDRGWVLAFCHVRGGGEMGRHWYDGGRLDQKHHSFEDFQSCVHLLHSAGYSQPQLTAAWGASAGGLLIAACCNRFPELLKAAVMRMPFVDVLSAMLDRDSPLTLQDTMEWGDPQTDAAAFETISSYSPYHNITSQKKYPSILVTTSTTDPRVPVWGPLKYMAQLRHVTCKDHRPTYVMKVYTDGGHFGPEEVDRNFDQATLEWAFLYRELGLGR
ncbi:prolyl endopeptidase-like [Diadema setosum]|uniref:prolyl endopeptidase-like n=1 Tax=Diadema setosum TaxID=31175 RepID=UPI003B3A1A5D